ncbi:MAG: discoidin domain-containing protein [Clostridia bacterium]|nr:discoidin domain-containing protein [Clostridia bacterium]
MKEKQKNRGITLIALVITIIVLLILSGISILALTGENGLIIKSIEAKQKNDEKSAAETVILAMNNYKVQKYSNNSIKFEDSIKNELKIDEMIENEDSTYTFEYKNYLFTVTEDEIISQTKGKETSDKKYAIKINYVDIDGNEIYESHIEEGIYGTKYEVENPEIDNYITIHKTVSGEIQKNQTINVIYEEMEKLVLYENGTGLIKEQEPYTSNMSYTFEDGFLLLKSPYGSDGYIALTQKIDFSQYTKMVIDGVRLNSNYTDYTHLYQVILSDYKSMNNELKKELFYVEYNTPFLHTTDISEIVDEGYASIRFPCGDIRISSWILTNNLAPAYKTYKEIENIENITIQNALTVQKILENYNLLTEKEKQLVTNYNDLISKVVTYNESLENDETNFIMPILTGNKCKIEECEYKVTSSSDIDAIRIAFRAFDGSTDSVSGCWHSSASTPQWLQIEFPSKVKISKFTIQNRDANTSANEGYTLKAFILQGSNDGSTWTDLGEYTNGKGSLLSTNFEVENPASYRYYRWYATSSYSSYITIGEITINEATIRVRIDY